MDEQSRKLLLDTYKLTEENHTMLKKLRRAQKNAHTFKAIYWVIIIGASYYAYLQTKPYLEQAKQFYTAAQVQLEGIKNITNILPGKK